MNPYSKTAISYTTLYCNILTLILIFHAARTYLLYYIRLPMIPKNQTAPAIFKAAFISIIGFGCMCSISFAQTELQTPESAITKPSTDPATRTIQQSIALMEQKQWQKALDLVNKLIAENKGKGVQKYGAKFATTYYYRGFCMLKLAQAAENETSSSLFKAAIQSFNQCFAINPPNDRSNIYRAKSLLLRGNAQQALQHYQSAIVSYQQFLDERNTARDAYSLSEFNINLAICMWKNATEEINKLSPSEPKLKQNEEIQDAITLIQQSLLHSGKNAPNPKALITGLNALSLISASLKDDEIIPTTIQNIHTTITENLNITRNFDPKNNSESITQITLSDNLTNLSNLSKIILKTSLQNLPQASKKLTSIFPGIQHYADELRISNTIISERSPNTKTYLQSETLPAELKIQLDDAIINVLKARALILQKSDKPDDIRAAVRLYKTIVDEFTNSINLENDLYSLIHVAIKSGHPADTDLALTRASQFLKNYPESALHKPTRTLYLSALYQDQQYQQALELAKKIISEEQKSSTSDPDSNSILQSAGFIHAAAHYYIGEYATADLLLAEHSNKYPSNNPNSIYRSDVTYLRAALQNQLLNWDASIPQLKAFIQQHTEPNNQISIYTPFAYYDIAYALYSQGKPHSAILALQPFSLEQEINLPAIEPEEKAFSSTSLRRSQITPSAAILLGNIRITLGEQSKAVIHYADAIKLAQQTGNIDARDEAYYHIIKTLGSRLWNGILNDRLAETLIYYEEFIALSDVKSSPYYTQILTSAITALEKSDPEEPVQLTLQNNLFLHNNKPNTPGIETSLKTYLYYLRKNKAPLSEVIHILTNDIKSTPSAYHQALLTVAKLEIYELQKQRILAAGELDKKALNEINTQIDQHYQELIRSYRSQDLDNFSLLKIAQYLTSANDGNNASEATEYFQAIIEHPSSIKQTDAHLGLALQKANSQKPEELTMAKQQLSNILNNPFTPLQAKVTAHYTLIKLLRSEPQPEWNKVESHSITYLKYPIALKNNNLDILETLAQAYTRQNKVDSAIATNTQIWASSLFSIQHSAPAIHRVCELLWERNNPSKPGINEGKSDRQLAYETAYKYIRKTKDHFSKRKPALTKESISTWEKVKALATKTYPQNSEVQAFEGQP